MNINFNFGFISGGSKSSDVSQKQQEVNQYQSELSQINGEVQNVEGEKGSAESEKSNADSLVSSTEASVQSANAMVSQAEAALSAAGSIPVETKVNEDGTQTQDSSKRDAAISAAQELVNQAKIELENAKSQNDEAKNQVEEAQARIDEVQGKIDELKGKQSDTEGKLQTAQSELQEAQAAQREEQAQQEEKTQNNDEQKNISILNPFGIEEDDKKDESLSFELPFENDKVTKEDVYEAAELSKVVLNPELYSPEEIEDASKKLEDYSNMELNYFDENTMKLSSIVSAAKEYQAGDTTKEDELKSQMLDTFRDEAIDMGFSAETANAISLAYMQVGIREDAGSNKGEMEKYQMSPNGGESGAAWCASFVSWLYGKGQSTDNLQTFGYDNSVRNIRSDAQQAGFYSRKEVYEPQPGDIMIQEDNGASHTGMVVKSDENYIYTIEGNAGNAVRAKKYLKGGEAASKISGYVRMNEWNGGMTNPFYNQNVLANYLPDDEYELADKEQSTL